MPDVWVPIQKGDESSPGETYRIAIHIHAPYTKKIVDLVETVVITGVGVRNVLQNPFDRMRTLWKIHRVYTAPPTAASHAQVDFPGGPNDSWTLYVEATKTDHGTEVLIAVGVILALFIGLVVVTGWQAERLEKFAKHTVLNPGVVLAVFILGAAFLARRGG